MGDMAAIGGGYGNRGAVVGMYGGRVDTDPDGLVHDGTGRNVNYGAAGSAAGARRAASPAAGCVRSDHGTTAGGRSSPTSAVPAGQSDRGEMPWAADRIRSRFRARGTAVAGRSAYGVSGARPYGFNAYGGYHSGWVHGYWNGHNSAAWGWRGATGAAGLGPGTGLGASGLGLGSGLGPLILGLRLVALRHGLHALQQRLLR